MSIMRAFRGRTSIGRARPLASAIIYELHIGTFTPEGTFTAAIERLRAGNHSHRIDARRGVSGGWL